LVLSAKLMYNVNSHTRAEQEVAEFEAVNDSKEEVEPNEW